MTNHFRGSVPQYIDWPLVTIYFWTTFSLLPIVIAFIIYKERISAFIKNNTINEAFRDLKIIFCESFYVPGSVKNYMSCDNMSCDNMSCDTMSCDNMSCDTMSCDNMSCDDYISQQDYVPYTKV
jgi:hypothetical protein